MHVNLRHRALTLSVDIKKCQTKIKKTKSPTKTLQMKPQIKRLQSNIDEFLWLLFITSNNKAKCNRPWAPILVFSQLNFSGFPPHFPLQAQYRIEAFICAAPVPSQNYTSCAFNFFSKDSENSPPQPQKKRRVYDNKSDDED